MNLVKQYPSLPFLLMRCTFLLELSPPTRHALSYLVTGELTEARFRTSPLLHGSHRRVQLALPVLRFPRIPFGSLVDLSFAFNVGFAASGS